MSQAARKTVAAVLGEDARRSRSGRSSPTRRKARARPRTEAELEQPVAAARLAVVVALRRRPGDDLDLAVVEAETAIDRGDLRLDRALVRQEEPGRAALDDRRRDRAAVDVGERLRGEDDADAFFLRSVFSHSRSWPAKPLVVEREPALVDDEQRRPAVQPVLDAVEEIGEHGGRRARADQTFGLEGLDRRIAEVLVLGVEQPAVGTADAVGPQAPASASLDCKQHGEAGQRPLLDGRRGERGQRRPEVLLHLRGDRHAFARQGSPTSQSAAQARSGVSMNAGERLERDVSHRPIGARPHQRSLRCGAPPRSCQSPPMASAAARIEPPKSKAKTWLLGVAAELQRHQRQQHGLAGAGRADDERVADVADMQRKAERGRAFGPGVEERRRVEMLVPSPARPRPPRAGSCGRDSASRSAAGGHWRRHGPAACRARRRPR